MAQIQDVPGMPDPAKSPAEYAVDRPLLTKIMFTDRQAFFDRNPAFDAMRAPVEAVVNRMLARRVLRRGDGGILKVDPACPRCQRTTVATFSRSVAQRFQLKFLACWTDPVRRPPMLNNLVEYCLQAFPEIQEKGLELVVNIHKSDGARERCLLYSAKG